MKKRLYPLFLFLTSCGFHFVQDPVYAKCNSAFCRMKSGPTAPSIPSGLVASVASSSSITLSWTPSTDNVGVAGYKIYRNGSNVGRSSSASFLDVGLSPGNYTYAVSAYDAAGNNSANFAQDGSVFQCCPPGAPEFPNWLNAYWFALFTALSVSIYLSRKKFSLAECNFLN